MKYSSALKIFVANRIPRHLYYLASFAFAACLVLMGVGPFLPIWVPLQWGYYCPSRILLIIAITVLLFFRYFVARSHNQCVKRRTIAFRWLLLGLLASPIIAGVISKSLAIKQISDYGDYLRLGSYLSKNGLEGLLQLDAWRPPGMAFILAIPLKLGLTYNQAVWSVNSLSLVLAVAGLSHISSGLQVERTRGITAVLIAIPLVALFLTIAASEIPAFAIQMLTIALFPMDKLTLKAVSAWKWLAAGCFTALAALFRPVLLVQLLALTVSAIFVCGMHCSTWTMRLKRIGIAISLIFIGFGVTMAPVTLRNYHKYHAFLLISYNGGEVFYASNKSAEFDQQGKYLPSHHRELRNEIPDPLKRNAIGFKRGLMAILKHPFVFVNSFPFRAGMMLGGLLTWPADYIGHANLSKIEPALLTNALQSVCLFSGWVILLLVGKSRIIIMNAIKRRFVEHWVLWCFIMVLISSMCFECLPRYSITLVPYILATIVFSVRAYSLEHPEV